MHLVGPQEDDRAGFGGFRLAIQVGFQCAFDHDHDFFVQVLVRRMRLGTRAQDGLVHFQIESGMLRSVEEPPALLLLVAFVGNLAVVVDLRGQRSVRSLLAGGGPRRQRGKQQSQLPVLD